MLPLFIHNHTDRYGDSNSGSCFRPPVHFTYRLRILKMAISSRLPVFSPIFLHEVRYGDILRSTFAMVSISTRLRLHMSLTRFLSTGIRWVSPQTVSHAALSDSIANLICNQNYVPRFELLKTAELSAWTILETNDLFLVTSILLQAQLLMCTPRTQTTLSR